MYKFHNSYFVIFVILGFLYFVYFVYFLYFIYFVYVVYFVYFIKSSDPFKRLDVFLKKRRAWATPAEAVRLLEHC